MNTRTFIASLVAGASMVVASAAYAETVKASGDVCWTGEIEYIGTTKKDTAWIWKADWTYMPDDKDLKSGASGKCFGSGGLVDGKPKIGTTFCSHNQVVGGKFMSFGMGGPKGSKGTYFGGTDKFAGITGGFVGGPEGKLPAGEGRLAGCRHVNGEYTTK